MAATSAALFWQLLPCWVLSIMMESKSGTLSSPSSSLHGSVGSTPWQRHHGSKHHALFSSVPHRLLLPLGQQHSMAAFPFHGQQQSSSPFGSSKKPVLGFNRVACCHVNERSTAMKTK